jgi:hypothetical protein
LARHLRLRGIVPKKMALEKSLRLALAMGEVVQRAGGSFSLLSIEEEPSGSRWPWERWYSEPVRLFYAPPVPGTGTLHHSFTFFSSPRSARVSRPRWPPLQKIFPLAE